MIFEGSEKKLEVVFNGVDLHSLNNDFWRDLVATANATILSETFNDSVSSFLLSESSLFVWQDRLTMITCGTTTLVNAIEFLFEKLGRENLSVLVFQRKNEHFSHLQSTTFYEDVSRIRKFVPGVSYRFGPKHEHHNFLFHSDVSFEPDGEDYTSELLMYDIQGASSDFLTQPGKSAEELRRFFKLDKILRGFDIDDFSFEPYGYSMNAIREDKYCTIHVTPQQVSSYVSFETNLKLDDFTKNIFLSLLDTLKPMSFDTVAFNDEIKQFVPAKYIVKNTVQEKLDIGYDVTFRHYFQENDKIERPHKF